MESSSPLASIPRRRRPTHPTPSAHPIHPTSSSPSSTQGRQSTDTADKSKRRKILQRSFFQRTISSFSSIKSSGSIMTASSSLQHPPFSHVVVCAALYVLSGVTQPILMAYAKHAGLADPKCQLYMLFYYVGPSLAGLSLRRRDKRKKRSSTSSKQNNDSTPTHDTNGTNIPTVNGIASGEKYQIRQNGANGADANGAKTFDDFNANGNSSNHGSNGSSHGKNYGSTSFSDEEEDKEEDCHDDHEEDAVDAEDADDVWPRKGLFLKAAGIAIFDIFAQSMCYTGNNLAGPTIFAIIYSSVTIWAAIYSQLFLSRSLTTNQWLGVVLVVVGLSLTALDSFHSGDRNMDHVFVGTCLILVGSSFHGLTYVLSEKIMKKKEEVDGANEADEADEAAEPTEMESLTASTEGQISANSANAKSTQFESTTAVPSIQRIRPKPKKVRDHISVQANCAIQGLVATLFLTVWQIIYTLPHFDELILTPMHEAQTTPYKAFQILTSITLANFLHSITFYQTLKHFPGGATSAGVLKGLQAVLVFVVSSVMLCGRWGGEEMCWNKSKFVSLVVVVGGIMLYGMSTERKVGSSGKDKLEEKHIDDGFVFSLRSVGGHGGATCV